MKFVFGRARGLFALGALAAAMLLAAGCGDSSDDGTSASGGDGGAVFPAAAEASAKWEERPTSIGIEKPVGKPIPKGKEIVFIQCGVPACETERQLLKQATDLLGWKLNSIPAGTTPEEIKAAYQKAIDDKPDAVSN